MKLPPLLHVRPVLSRPLSPPIAPSPPPFALGETVGSYLLLHPPPFCLVPLLPDISPNVLPLYSQ
eukprot:699969-Hanusia_phi.AAC.1